MTQQSLYFIIISLILLFSQTKIVMTEKVIMIKKTDGGYEKTIYDGSQSEDATCSEGLCCEETSCSYNLIPYSGDKEMITEAKYEPDLDPNVNTGCYSDKKEEWTLFLGEIGLIINDDDIDKKDKKGKPGKCIIESQEKCGEIVNFRGKECIVVVSKKELKEPRYWAPIEIEYNHQPGEAIKSKELPTFIKGQSHSVKGSILFWSLILFSVVIIGVIIYSIIQKKRNNRPFDMNKILIN